MPKVVNSARFGSKIRRRKRRADPDLLTTHAVASLEDALRIVLVSGALDDRAGVPNHEEPGLRSGAEPDPDPAGHGQAHPRRALIAALRTMQLVYARSGTTGQKLSDAMDETAEPAGRSPHRQARGEDRQVEKSARQRNLGAPFLGRRAIGGWTDTTAMATSSPAR